MNTQRPIKVRYRIRSTYGKDKGKVTTIFRTLEELEENGLELNEGVNEVISRDQSTGLLDKNGKEVFRGDVVNLGGTTVFCVVWDQAQARFALDPTTAKGRNLAASITNRGEVIGDIYTTPHLLKPKVEN
jgi:hypothetical protein